MIEIRERKINETSKVFNIFTLLNDGFYDSNHEGTGWVQMDCRLSDTDSEGNVFFIDVTDNMTKRDGGFAALEMDAEELSDFIDYLKSCHKKLLERQPTG